MRLTGLCTAAMIVVVNSVMSSSTRCSHQGERIVIVDAVPGTAAMAISCEPRTRSNIGVLLVGGLPAGCSPESAALDSLPAGRSPESAALD